MEDTKKKVVKKTTAKKPVKKVVTKKTTAKKPVKKVVAKKTTSKTKKAVAKKTTSKTKKVLAKKATRKVIATIVVTNPPSVGIVKTLPEPPVRKRRFTTWSIVEVVALAVIFAALAKFVVN